MSVYQAPLADLRFVLHELLDVSDQLASLNPSCEINQEIIDAVLEAAGQLGEELLHPGSREADESGCQLVEGKVVTPDGYKKAYAAIREGGWCGVTADEDDGGLGLPQIVGRAVSEIFQTADISFADYVGLITGAYATIRAHADDDLKARYLPRLASGEWAGTMCMTEPGCGTDLGLMRTQAVPSDDGTFRVSGTKIFISGGDQDLTENIVHLVLAKLPEAPQGSRGISLFLVPKVLPNGERNRINAVRLEHKMGYHGSATCEMHFDGAMGWMIGEPHHGLACMFTMVNHSRIEVGLQGYCQSVKAYQSAVAYAQERKQGRSLLRPKEDRSGADPIIVHPDIRRKLLKTKAFVECARAISLWCTLEIDRSETLAVPASRQSASDRVELLTPVIKAVFSDFGFETCNDCMDVFGGHGFIRDNGMEQLVRDVRLSQIQEGTNHVQALDLLGRKLQMHGGRLYREFADDVRRLIQRIESKDEMREFSDALGAALKVLDDATSIVMARIADDREETGASGFEYMRIFGYVLMAWMWAWMADLAVEKMAREDRLFEPDFYTGKLATARFFYRHMLPMIHGHARVLGHDKRAMMELDSDAF